MTATTSKTLIALSTIIAVVVITYLVLWHRPSPCDVLFEQTSSRFGVKIELLKTKGEVLIGREKVQDLTERVQLAAVNIQACCIGLEEGKLNPKEFQECKGNVAQQEALIAQIVTAVSEAQAAKDQSRPDVVSQKVAEVGRLIEEVKTVAEVLNRQIAAIKNAPAARASEAPDKKEEQPAQKLPPMKENRVAVGNSEREPNDDVFQANATRLDAAVAGEILSGEDQDWFVFRADTRLKDWLVVRIENRSTTLRPCVTMYDGNRNQIGSECAGNQSANLEQPIIAEPGKDYYISVGSYYGQTTGAYAFSVIALKAYDAYEPNDDIFSAKPVAAGKAVEANIMHNGDADWYMLKGFPAKQLIARVENRSTTLRPCVWVFDSNRNQIGTDCAQNASANVELITAVEPGKDGYVSIGSYYGQTAGVYRLTVEQGKP